MTADEILKVPEEHIRKAFLEFFIFASMEEKSNDEMFAFDEKLKTLSEILRSQNVEFTLAYRIYDEEILNDYSLDELKAMEEPFIFLMERKTMIEAAYYTPKKDRSYMDNEDDWVTSYLSTCDAMLKQYGVEFIGMGWKGDEKKIFALKSDTDIKFEVSGGISHRFVPALAQKLLSDMIYQMIDEEGASDYMGGACSA